MLTKTTCKPRGDDDPMPGKSSQRMPRFALNFWARHPERGSPQRMTGAPRGLRFAGCIPRQGYPLTDVKEHHGHQGDTPDELNHCRGPKETTQPPHQKDGCEGQNGSPMAAENGPPPLSMSRSVLTTWGIKCAAFNQNGKPITASSAGRVHHMDKETKVIVRR